MLLNPKQKPLPSKSPRLRPGFYLKKKDEKNVKDMSMKLRL